MKNSLLDRLKADYPDFRFVDGKKFKFRPPATIVVGPVEPYHELLLLHEVAHGLCGHTTFRTDIERLKMESEAWSKAHDLANDYSVSIDEEFIQEQLDTYRDWLHKKSCCPICKLTRFQTTDLKYHCPSCEGLGSPKK